MIATAISFDPAREDLSADGWSLSVYQEGDDEAEPLVTYYATYTLAAAAQKAAFQDDPDISAYFLAKAQQQVLTAQEAAVTSANNTLRTAEGL